MHFEVIAPLKKEPGKQELSDSVGRSGAFRDTPKHGNHSACAGWCRLPRESAHLLLDGSLFALALSAAFFIRYGALNRDHWLQLLLWLPVLVALRLNVNRKAGVYRFIWRFICLSDVVAIFWALFLASLVPLALRFFWPAAAQLAYWVRLPVGIIALEYFQSLFLTLGVRAAARIRFERSHTYRLGSLRTPKRVLFYGAGRAGVLLARDLGRQADIDITGFVDDAAEKQGTFVAGLPVFGSGNDLGRIVRHHQVEEVVISVAAAGPASLARIVALCRRIPVHAKIVPSLRELLSKEAAIAHIRDIRVEDLLGRCSMSVDALDDRSRAAYRGKSILVTGAGGSIGSELTRQLLALEPRKISILDKDENTIYDLEQELKFRNPEVPIEPLIADIKIRERVFAVFAEAKPEVVFHAAAHKHVPLMEKHPCEAVLNNILGTRNVLEACSLFGVRRFIFISSDKAVNPTNVMGATKRVGEKLVSSFARDGRLRSACVRFGNVMGSRGSVIPLFQRQIELGGPVTVTHPDIVRFFMTIPEAVQLVLSAGSLAGRGEVFVLDMGSPRRILDLARQMIVLCGLEPGQDIEIAITGLRPGEKMHEELVAPGESVISTCFDKISSICQSPFDVQDFCESSSRIIKSAQRNDKQGVYDLLASMEIGFTPLSVLVREKREIEYVMVS